MWIQEVLCVLAQGTIENMERNVKGYCPDGRLTFQRPHWRIGWSRSAREAFQQSRLWAQTGRTWESQAEKEGFPHSAPYHITGHIYTAQERIIHTRKIKDVFKMNENSPLCFIHSAKKRSAFMNINEPKLTSLGVCFEKHLLFLPFCPCNNLISLTHNPSPPPPYAQCYYFSLRGKIGAGVDWNEAYGIPGNDLLIVDATKIALALRLIIDTLFNSNCIFL